MTTAFKNLLDKCLEISVNLPKCLLKSQKDIFFKQVSDSFFIGIIKKFKHIFYNSIFHEAIKKLIFWFYEILKLLQEILKKDIKH